MFAGIFEIARFIPAYAGNSSTETAPLGKTTVHPRLRGELAHILNQDIDTTGSSPLTRGTLQKDIRYKGLPRFIPAYAGNSLKDGINPSIHTLGI